MKKMMKLAAVALAGALTVTGCVSSGLTDEEMAKVGPWYDMAVVLKDASSPELSKPINTKVASLDAVAAVVSPIANKVSSMTSEYIRRVYADTAWDAYVGWYNGPTASQLKGEELAAKAAVQAKLACFEQGLAMNTVDPVADARRVMGFRALDRSDDVAIEQFLAENSSEALLAWSKALIEANSKGREGFYAAIKVEPAKEKTDMVAYLTKALEDLTKANAQLTAALSDSTLAKSIAAASFGAEIVQGVSGKETLAEIDRLKDQLAITGRLTPWLLDAIQNDK